MVPYLLEDKVKTYLLIDADVVAYRAAIYCETIFDFGDGEFIEYHEEELPDYIDGEMMSYCTRLQCDNLVAVLSSSTNFRKEILPTYKGNRPPKPKLLKMAQDYIRDNYDTREKDSLEGDDVLGILSTHPKLLKGKKIIVSIDKDMQTIPGFLFNPDKDEGIKEISGVMADRYWLMQAMTGDSTDCYKGCPGIGPVKAMALINDVVEWGTPWATDEQLVTETWNRIVQLFESKGLTEEDALVQARVARILRHSDYDYKTKKIRLWEPAS